MAQLGLRDQWPVRAMQSGGVLGSLGMIGGQIAQGSTLGQVIFTVIFAIVFLAAIWLLAIGAARRSRADGTERLSEREPRRSVVIGLMMMAVVMWLAAGYGAFIAVLWQAPADAWLELAYLGIALCATGATVVMRRSRQEWLAHYRRDWPSEG